MTVTSDDEIDIKALVKNNNLLEAPSDQDEFNKLSQDKKLDRLNVLIQKTQVYSQIIAENILESTQSPKIQQPTKKKRKTSKGVDITQMLTSKSSKDTKETRKAIEESQTAATIPQPSMVTGGTLKDYQLEGLQWLVTLFENGLNGILADEMGLGKTLQCLSFLSFLIEQGIRGPFLIVVPLSTLSNWANEIKKFAPGISVLKFIGSKQHRTKINLSKVTQDTNIVITSYETSIKDFNKLKKVNWKYLIVDEGHRLKNSDCVLIKILKQIPTSNRLLITGTPLQNNLNELWSLLNFILPDIFHDLELFQQWFNFDELTDLTKDDDEETKSLVKIKIQESLIKNLHTILKPFILRRLKKDVIKNLPPKKEYLVHIPMSEIQESLYYKAMNNSLFTGLVELHFKEFINYNHPEFCDEANCAFIDEFLQKKCEPVAVKSKKRKSYKEAESEDEFIESDTDDVTIQKTNSYEDVLDNLKNGSLSSSHAKLRILETLYDMIYKETKSLSLNNLMMQLRNICGSPYLYYEPFLVSEENTHEQKFMDILFKNTSKLHVLNQICKPLFENGHKVLIFSQFTRMLDLLQDWFRSKNIDVSRLDGSVDLDSRDIEINKFNTDSSRKVFLLSTRSGGLGINLTAADTVILFDNDWNPQMDLQAIDRVHRIGQNKPVKIFRFIINNSIEEILLTKSSSKRFLEKLIIQLGEFKFKRLKELIALEDKKELNVKELVDMSRVTFKQTGKDEPISYSYAYGDKNSSLFQLSEAELDELLDRSPDCYNNDTSNFENITIFETINNMDAD